MQWALGQPNGVDIDIIDAWRMIDELPADHQFADEVKVALIGFGVETDSDHPDFQSIGPNGQIITGIPGQDFVDNDSNPKDELAWHEAMAMGVIAAGHNNKWTAGMVNGVDEGSRIKVLPIRIRSVDDEVLRMLAEAMPYDEDLVLKFTSNGNKEEVHLNPAHFNCLNTNDLPSTNAESSQYLLENGYGYAVPAWNSTDLNLRDVVATTCMATLSINYARSINEATSENEKLLRLAALAWIINKVDLS